MKSWQKYLSYNLPLINVSLLLWVPEMNITQTCIAPTFTWIEDELKKFKALGISKCKHWPKLKATSQSSQNFDFIVWLNSLYPPWVTGNEAALNLNVKVR